MQTLPFANEVLLKQLRGHDQFSQHGHKLHHLLTLLLGDQLLEPLRLQFSQRQEHMVLLFGRQNPLEDVTPPPKGELFDDVYKHSTPLHGELDLLVCRCRLQGLLNRLLKQVLEEIL